MNKTSCEECLYYDYDDEYEEYYCMLNFDEDDAVRHMRESKCPFFRFGDDYTIVRKQN